jgi:signal transduction histidine kinase
MAASMKSMFNRIRWRLVAWTMLVVGLILLVLGTAVHVAVARSLLDQIDRNLASRSEVAGPFFPGLERRGPPEREGYRGGVFYLALDPDGRVVGNPQRVDVEGVEFPRPSGRSPVFATVVLDDEPTRVFVRWAEPSLMPGARLVVGQSLAAEEAALNSLLIVLVAGGGVGLLLSFLGAWFLSGRSLVPIEQAFRRQQEFVADASHELRTPLTVLRSATELLNRHRAEPLEANGDLFDDVRFEIDRLERLTVDLLTLARSDRGELQLAVAPLNLGDLAADVVRRTAPLALERGVKLSHQQERAVAEVDPDRLNQVLLILLDNAIQHTPAGGSVEVRVHRQATEALIEVTDTGQGIPPEHLTGIFDRFYRVDPSRSRAQGRTGLGLAIARGLIEAHGGQLTLTSRPQVGTVATIRLSLADEQDWPAPDAAPQLEQTRSRPEPTVAPTE